MRGTIPVSPDSHLPKHITGDVGSIPGPGRSPGEGNGRKSPPVFLPGKSLGLPLEEPAGYSPCGRRVRHDLVNEHACTKGPQLLIFKWV